MHHVQHMQYMHQAQRDPALVVKSGSCCWGWFDGDDDGDEGGWSTHHAPQPKEKPMRSYLIRTVRTVKYSIVKSTAFMEGKNQEDYSADTTWNSHHERYCSGWCQHKRVQYSIFGHLLVNLHHLHIPTLSIQMYVCLYVSLYVSIEIGIR